MFNYLPVGTVVFLKNLQKKVMIIGVNVIANQDENRVFDYIGVMYPEGYLGNDQGNFLFNHDDINDVVFEGYNNPEREEYIIQLNSKVEDIDKALDQLEEAAKGMSESQN